MQAKAYIDGLFTELGSDLDSQSAADKATPGGKIFAGSDGANDEFSIAEQYVNQLFARIAEVLALS